MSAGARHGTVLAEIQVEFSRTGRGLFHFAHWYAEQMRALKSSMGRRFPHSKLGQERQLLSILRAR